MSQLPLSTLLEQTAEVCRQVLAGQSLTAVLSRLPLEKKAGVQALSFFVMRYLNRGQALSAELIKSKVPNRLFANLLDVSLCLLSAPYFAQIEQKQGKTDTVFVFAIPQYDVHTLVNQAVEAACINQKTRNYKSLLNACLRNFLRQAGALTQKVWQQETVRYAFPQWWIDHLRIVYPDQWQAILKSANQAPPLSLRVNHRQISKADFLKALDKQGIEVIREDHANPFLARAEDAVVLQKPMLVQQIPGFEQGWFSVQDVSAQLANSLIPLQNGDRVLDACAAPGGKTAHLLEHYDLDLTVLDIDEKRLQRVKDNLRRLQLGNQENSKIHLQAADATDLNAWYKGVPFDVVMVDAPCTASGIVRRHPDIKWLRKPQDITQTVQLQQAILRALWQTVKPGGYLLYITCSIFPQENEEQAQFILAHLPNSERISALGQLLPVPFGEQKVVVNQAVSSESPEIVMQDGFFYALFRKMII